VRVRWDAAENLDESAKWKLGSQR